MDSTYRHIINSSFSILIIIATFFISERFILALSWAAVIATIAWPCLGRIERTCRGQQTLTAVVATTLLTLTVALPLLYMLKLLLSEVQGVTSFLLDANKHGIAAPTWFANIPVIGHKMTSYWQNILGTPDGLASALSHEAHHYLTYLSEFARKLGFQLFHRTMILGFTLLCLFFFFRDGRYLITQVNQIGENCMGQRWHVYSHRIPDAIRATVNGVVLVGLGVGIIMGCIYTMLGAPAPALFGALTALFAMIPFAVPFVFALLSVILLAQAKILATMILITTGTVVMFIADHFVRPVLIQGATRLPFLAVLFGILGGVETLGIIGLFIGPVIMILFVTLWQELAKN